MNFLEAQNLIGKKVLLVDGQLSNIDVLINALKSERLNISIASNGKKALEIVKTNKPDLILLDVMLPEMDGFETCRKLKADESSKDIPLIFITASTERKDIEEGFAAGCEDYVTKPFLVEEVRNRVRTQLLLGKQKLQKGLEIIEEDVTNIAGLQVLIVDDDPVSIYVLKKSLKPENFNISIATNGKIAVEIASRILPDLILLDIMMPQMGGFEVCRNLKANELTKEIPIIFVTAKNQPEDIEKGFFLGGVDYILKPFRETELRARVTAHLKVRKVLLQKEIWIQQLEEAKSELQDNILARTASLQEAVEKAEQAKTMAEESNRAKSEFLSELSHELRTPMNAILGFSQILEMSPTEPLTSKQKLNVAHIRNAGEYLLLLINEVLDLGKIGSGKINLSFERVHFSKIVEEQVMPLIAPMAEEWNISLENKISSHPDALIFCDPIRVTQIMLNLASNAIKFNREGGSVTLDYQQTQKGKACITIADTGPGIPKDKMETVFQPFYRLESNNPEAEGVGIGLTITKRLVELMEGRIFMQSVIGQGTCFTVELPITE